MVDKNGQSLKSVFQELGEEFKGMGRELAKAFDFEGKDKKTKKDTKTDMQNQTRNNSNKNETPKPKCPSCGKPINVGVKYCTFCGTPINESKTSNTVPLETICPACGKKLKPDLKVCTECGTKIPDKMDFETKGADTLTVKENEFTVEQQIDLLQKLKSLLDAGIITPAEFEQKKKKIFF